MKHEDIMIFHRIKYKHIGTLLLLLGAISAYWTVDLSSPTITAYGMASFMCCFALGMILLFKFISNWNDEIL